MGPRGLRRALEAMESLTQIPRRAQRALRRPSEASQGPRGPGRPQNGPKIGLFWAYFRAKSPINLIWALPGPSQGLGPRRALGPLFGPLAEGPPREGRFKESGCTQRKLGQNGAHLGPLRRPLGPKIGASFGPAPEALLSPFWPAQAEMPSEDWGA